MCFTVIKNRFKSTKIIYPTRFIYEQAKAGFTIFMRLTGCMFQSKQVGANPRLG